MPTRPLAKVYNLLWLTQIRGYHRGLVARNNPCTLSLQKHIEAVILYPAMATPEILTGDNELEILLLTKESFTEPKLRSYLQTQLKISSGLEAFRPCAERGLFVDASGAEVGSASDRKISIQGLSFDANTKLSTKSGRFAGYVDKRACKVYQDAGYTTLYSISMSNKCISASEGNQGVESAGEPQDLLITKVLQGHDEQSDLKQPDGKYYTFPVSGDDVDFSRYDLETPIQSWHPVFFYPDDSLQYANIAHVSDVHLAARQQVMAKSRARVIDYACNGREDDEVFSPAIGDRINVCSKDLKSILNQFGGSDADLLLIGGDLVDFLRSVHPGMAWVQDATKGRPSEKPSSVWNNVGLDDSYKNTYKNCVDMMAFYGMLLQYCSSNAKPAFLISGNHDCYWEPYGLSPRIGGSVIDHRANEGIPSDHNLTFYEAILVFGNTFRTLKGGLGSPYSPPMFDWFYIVFTPFTDYSTELPKQYLIACGWGDQSEDLFDFPGSGHGFGHLPRSKDGVSDHQLGLLEEALKKGKNLILMTHFTFVSYAESIPNSNTDLGDVYFSLIKNFEEHNLGTFNTNRQKMIEGHCGQRDIQIVLTGHSHRRALYLIDHLDYLGRASAKVRHFDFDAFGTAQNSYPGILKPAIIVSDSGGTIPRYNLDGEFNGRGSDPPSGTLVLFGGDTGDIASIAAVRANTCTPRLAVALDYLDIQEMHHAIDPDEYVILKFVSKEFNIAAIKTGALPGLAFDIVLNDHLFSRGVSAAGVVFYAKASTFDWKKIQLLPTAERQAYICQKHPQNEESKPGLYCSVCGQPLTVTAISTFSIQGNSDVQTFANYMATNQERGNFMAISFKRQKGFERYNFDDSWCFEFQVSFEMLGGLNVDVGSFSSWVPGSKRYVILRDKKRAEIPDFDWRKKCIPDKYA